ncbi:hypothetical protein WN51_14018 [Melipona quadrifasciata]|uniref:Uncharacterized protein n=1 Tax=Melipona quadrifasciata TaxID=166423 RepID=A0A0M8ZYX3_9HYME|nr:hypothetical protein WN51_14018 [Melipona quadrifasciata]
MIPSSNSIVSFKESQVQQTFQPELLVRTEDPLIRDAAASTAIGHKTNESTCCLSKFKKVSRMKENSLNQSSTEIVNHTIKLPIPRQQIEITPAIRASMQSSESSEEHNESLHFHGAEVSKLWYRTGLLLQFSVTKRRSLPEVFPETKGLLLQFSTTKRRSLPERQINRKHNVAFRVEEVGVNGPVLFMRESEGETQGRGRRATGIETDRVVHLDVTYREKRAQAAPGVGCASLASATTLAILELPATPSRLSKRASQKCRTLHHYWAMNSSWSTPCANSTGQKARRSKFWYEFFGCIGNSSVKNLRYNECRNGRTNSPIADKANDVIIETSNVLKYNNFIPICGSIQNTSKQWIA